MEIDEKLLQRLKSMDDDTLRRAVGEIAALSGATESQRQRALRNIGTIRKKLTKANQNDLKKAVDSLGEENIEEAIRRLKL